MANFFDQFDAAPSSAAPQGNFFDQFDAPAAKQEAPITASGLYKATDVGLQEGVAGLASLPRTVGTLGGQGIQSAANWVSRKLGLPEDTRDLDKQKGLVELPTYESALNTIRKDYGGQAYTPQNTTEEYFRTGGQMLPNLIGGGGIIRSVVAPAIASETAGQLTKGTAAEPYARTATAMAAPFVTAGGRRIITPLSAPSAERQAQAAVLAQEGIQPSAGQITGSKPLQYFEQALGDMPGAGRAGTRATERTAEQFTQAALRRAGENAPRATTEVIDNAFTRIGQQFDDLAARNVLQPDPAMGGQIRNTIGDYNRRVSPPNRIPAIADYEQEIATALATNRNTLPGDVYQSLRSRIGDDARSMTDPNAQRALYGLQNSLDSAMQRHLQRIGSPDVGAWEQARRQYRNMLVLEKAATSAGENAALGLISPSALRNATVGQGRRAYARGQGDFADLARAGEAIMKPLPQSGTAPRAFMQNIPSMIGAGIGGGMAGLPGAAIGLAGPAIMGRVLMSPLAQRYLANQRLPPIPGVGGTAAGSGLLSMMGSGP